MNCRFSIIVPVYNAEAYLRECVESLINQTYPDFEILLINDGSKDSSPQICDEYAVKDIRVKAFHKENGGQLHTRQFGIERASNEWLLFVDSDDYIERDTLEKINAVISENDCDCLVFGFRQFEGEKTLLIKKAADVLTVIDNKSELFRLLMISTGYNAMCMKAVKKSCFDQIDYSDLYKIRIAEDKLHSAEVFNNAEKVVLMPDVFYQYRCNPSSVMNTMKLDAMVDFAVDAKIVELIENQELFTEADYYELRAESVKRIIESVWFIVSANVDKNTQIEYLNKLKKDSFYVNFISKGKYNKSRVGNKHFIYLLHKFGLYGLIFLIRKIAPKK